MRNFFRFIGFCLFVATCLFCFTYGCRGQVSGNPKLPVNANIEKAWIPVAYNGLNYKIAGSTLLASNQLTGSPVISLDSNSLAYFELTDSVGYDDCGVLEFHNTSVDVHDLHFNLQYQHPYTVFSVPVLSLNDKLLYAIEENDETGFGAVVVSVNGGEYLKVYYLIKGK